MVPKLPENVFREGEYSLYGKRFLQLAPRDTRNCSSIQQRERVASQIILGDVLKVNLPYFNVCVANIPYQVRLYNPLRTKQRS